MSHCFCMCDGEFLLTWICQHALSVHVCVFMCIFMRSTWKRLLYRCRRWALPFITKHAHKYLLALCHQWRAHTLPLYTHSQRQKEKYRKRHIGFSVRFNRHTVQPAQQTFTRSYFFNRNLHCVSLRNPAVTSAPVTSAAGLLCIFVQICEHVRVYVHTPESFHSSDPPLTGSLLYLTFTLKS